MDKERAYHYTTALQFIKYLINRDDTGSARMMVLGVLMSLVADFDLDTEEIGKRLKKEVEEYEKSNGPSVRTLS
jgi:hypothetical protein